MEQSNNPLVRMWNRFKNPQVDWEKMNADMLQKNYFAQDTPEFAEKLGILGKLLYRNPKEQSEIQRIKQFGTQKEKAQLNQKLTTEGMTGAVMGTVQPVYGKGHKIINNISASPKINLGDLESITTQIRRFDLADITSLAKEGNNLVQLYKDVINKSIPKMRARGGKMLPDINTIKLELETFRDIQLQALRRANNLTKQP